MKLNTTRWNKVRKKALIRDGYKCVRCGAQEKLHIHHIKPKSIYPALTYKLDNLITLCRCCHKKEHDRLGYGTLSKKQVDAIIRVIAINRINRINEIDEIKRNRAVAKHFIKRVKRIKRQQR